MRAGRAGVLGLLLAAMLTGGCKGEPKTLPVEPATSQSPLLGKGIQSKATARVQGDTLWLGGVRWVAPKGWRVQSPKESTRSAEWVSDQGDVVAFFQFGKGGGSVADNLKRWEGQFLRVDSSRVISDSSGVPWTMGSWTGEFAGAMGAEDQKGRSRTLIGVIVQGSEGSIFLKSLVDPLRAKDVSSALMISLGGLRPGS